MAEQFLTNFVAAGCLIINYSAPPPELLSQCDSWEWLYLVRDFDELPAHLAVSERVQKAILASSTFAPFSVLWSHGWLQAAFSMGRLRVYILPHDVDRSAMIPRSDSMKLITALLGQLEYSHDCWKGSNTFTPQNWPTLENAPTLSADSDTSLLTIFNNVTSPHPRPETESDELRFAMDNLMESQVPGLTTRLYPYQGRSAALMLKRELAPGRVVDPRLHSALDQLGKAWYFDDVSGLVLKEPRLYDAPNGGILAEEMGTGKTIICLALILSTKSEPSRPPEHFVAETRPRARIASLMDMAAAAANKASIPWKPYFDYYDEAGLDYQNCKKTLLRVENRAMFRARNSLVEPRRSNRIIPRPIPSKIVYLSWATLIIAPGNLIKQWQTEIQKHTTGLNVLVMVARDAIPPVSELLKHDIILFSDSRLERIEKERSNGEGPPLDTYCPLEHIHFKRCIIDEGHKLGNGSRGWKNDVMRVIDRLEISARWVVTGTPSRGLYGIQAQKLPNPDATNGGNDASPYPLTDAALKQERDDLQRIGNLAAKYLKVRPWANAKDEIGDSVADWNIYNRGANRKNCLITTLDSLLVRHRLADVSTLLPPVHERVVVLDGSFQDQLCLNLFSMMIIFNAVQSQRTDIDYFFHERQRKSLLQLVKNLRQASFFGGVFFSSQDIANAVDIASNFIEKKDVLVSPEDEQSLHEALDFGRNVIENGLKDVSNRFHALPIYLRDFPGGKGSSWALDGEESEEGHICTDAALIKKLQHFLNPCLDAPTSLQLMISTGRLEQQGIAERSSTLASLSNDEDGAEIQTPQVSQRIHLAGSLAGVTSLGDDQHTTRKSRKSVFDSDIEIDGDSTIPGTSTVNEIEVAGPLSGTAIISTASAKLSYLIDSIVKYQDEEQILIFYDNDNVAFYLAEALEILDIQYLIYTRAGLTAERRAQYVATFTHNPQFRVLLMDITQAAFGLDMKTASRIYFISPVLNPQVVAQAIGRARRISQQKPVTVETLVLRNSIEEVVVDRQKHMTQAEHSKIKNVVDDGKIKEWIRNAKINPLPDIKEGLAQTAMLETPQYVFGRGFGRVSHSDEGLITCSPGTESRSRAEQAQQSPLIPYRLNVHLKRRRSPSHSDTEKGQSSIHAEAKHPRQRKQRADIAWADRKT
ncbi:hypothetical protein GGR57DRAFT_488618 [Xylariaceae sp. FL1272]|nr:hypothetical protein GGR57DRAFT_488618 [Xylariaceae sp. FL1272]